MADEDLLIEPAEAGHLVKDEGAILIDVVGTGAWPTLREVPASSLRIPPPEFRERVEELPQGPTYIAYCT